MENKKVKKINVLYLLCSILLPIALIVAGGWIWGKNYAAGTELSTAWYLAPIIISILWWVFGGQMIRKSRQKSMEKALDAKGFSRNQTFNGKSCTVIVDAEHGQVALLFFWNPFEYFVFPTSRISKAWVDDGCFGAGIMKGSSRVSFLFVVDGVKVRVNTFTSNKRWRMDSNYILTGISKADMMVKVLQTAGAQTN